MLRLTSKFNYLDFSNLKTLVTNIENAKYFNEYRTQNS